MSSACANVAVKASATASQTIFIAPPFRLQCSKTHLGRIRRI
jgi:hypothetical protein